jgi:hypothetical protein
VEVDQRIDHSRQRVSLCGCDEFRGKPSFHDRIVVQQDDIITARGESMTDADIVPGGESEVFAVLMDFESGEPSADVLRSPIRRPVIDDEDANMFTDNGKKGLEAFFGILPPVPCQQNDIGKRGP